MPHAAAVTDADPLPSGKLAPTAKGEADAPPKAPAAVNPNQPAVIAPGSGVSWAGMVKVKGKAPAQQGAMEPPTRTASAPPRADQRQHQQPPLFIPHKTTNNMASSATAGASLAPEAGGSAGAASGAPAASGGGGAAAPTPPAPPATGGAGPTASQPARQPGKGPKGNGGGGGSGPRPRDTSPRSGRANSGGKNAPPGSSGSLVCRFWQQGQVSRGLRVRVLGFGSESGYGGGCGPLIVR